MCDEKEHARSSAATGDDVLIRRDWLKHIIATLQGPLPSGRIGDVVFLLRDQLQDILDRPVIADEPQAAPEKSAVIAAIRRVARVVEQYEGAYLANPSEIADAISELSHPK